MMRTPCLVGPNDHQSGQPHSAYHAGATCVIGRIAKDRQAKLSTYCLLAGSRWLMSLLCRQKMRPVSAAGICRYLGNWVRMQKQKAA